jgi:hypothetical protein
VTSRAHRLAAVLFTACMFTVWAGLAQAQQAGGTAPTIINRPLSAVPNAQAVSSAFWVPDLDAGFVPQGLAWQGGSLVLSGYVSTDAGQSRGPCRLVWINPSSGQATRRLNLPPSCGHAGGIAALPGGRLVVADTKELFIVSGGQVTGSVRLKGRLRGSFADFDGQDLWIGLHDRGGGALWRLPLSVLDRPGISEADAAGTLSAPAGMQGLAFDSSGQMWATTSGSKSGAIMRLDRRSGAVLASYAAPAGIEDISFDSSGRLWASSEAGTRRWSGWQTFYPLVFAIDVAALR